MSPARPARAAASARASPARGCERGRHETDILLWEGGCPPRSAPCLNGLGGGRFRAFSAGSAPSGRVNPIALDVLAMNGYRMQGTRSKDLKEFTRSGAPSIDFVITLCDAAAGESCPVFPGRPVRAHWGVRDPAAVEGTDDEKRRAFAEVLGILRRRVQTFTSLPFDSIDKLALKDLVHEIGER